MVLAGASMSNECLVLVDILHSAKYDLLNKILGVTYVVCIFLFDAGI